MKTARLPSLHRVQGLCLLALLLATQVAVAGPERGFRPGFRGYGPRGGYGYGYRGRFYGRPGWHGGPRWGWGWGPGFFVSGLPMGCLTLSFGGAAWYYGGGYWYRPYGAGFMVDFPPAGIVIPALPYGCTTFVDGGLTYYCANDVYYTAGPGGYVVTAPPPGWEDLPGQPPAGSPDAAALEAMVIIPKRNQSDDKILADRREAQRYAAAQSRYDPARSDPADPGTPRARQAYLRAMRSYLERQGYSVK